jgi:exodeoxyribonuclease V gamma subunit
MPSLKLYTSNKLENLLDALSEVVKTPLSSPLLQEIIVVQNKGMQHWISIQLSEKYKVWANAHFLFPNSFVEEMFKQVIMDYATFDPHHLTWRIMEVLPNLINRPDFEPIKNYLIDCRQLKLYQLCSQIADIFDQYSIYRPEVVLGWEKGQKSNWQSILWQTLFSEGKPKHRAKLREDFFASFERFYQNKTLWNGISRISIFGISSLPPFHAEIIHALSTKIDVNMFLLNPSVDFWDDILSEREIHKIIKKKGKKHSFQTDLHWDQGNSLLASLGAYGRDFISLMHGFEGEEFQIASDPKNNSLLSGIQYDILHLRQRVSQPVSIDDNSIQIHSCHSPMREMEVLYDNILLLFQKNESLKPSDIAIMTPNIELYAPTIQAVFGGAETMLPYSIADIGTISGNNLIETFFLLLQLSQSRFTVNEVLSILESPAILKAFDLNDSDLDLIRTWIEGTNIHWGLSKETFSFFNIPAIAATTWETGIKSMLLGYSMAPGNENRVVNSILPYEGIEGTQSKVLGNFLDFIEQLESFHLHLKGPHTLVQWSEIISNLINKFFSIDDENAAPFKVLHDCLFDLSSMETKTGFSGEIDLEVITNHLKKSLSKIRYSSGFISGAMTFCEMLPMRSIPFKVLCMVGMNDNAFPRRSRHLAWNLMAVNPQKGDRSLEKEDRYIFLEALLSARDVFYISYVGQDIQDNSTRQPSVLVTELLDYIENGFVSSTHPSVPFLINKIHIFHKLQGFSSQYFRSAGPLFSFSKENFITAQTKNLKRTTKLPFFTQSITFPEQEISISIQDLCSFFKNPLRALVQKKLGISFENKQSPLSDNEPFSIEGLNAYAIGQELVEQLINGRDRKSCYDFFKAAGRLPYGNIGRYAFDLLFSEAETFAEKVRATLIQNPIEKTYVSGLVKEISISGELKGFSRKGLMHYRFANSKATDKICLWLHHLALECFHSNNQSVQSLLICRDEGWEIPRINGPLFHLENILKMYISGLSNPLFFFPETSLAFAVSVLLKNKNSLEALSDAKKMFEGNDYTRGENQDPYLSFCFENVDPLNDKFQDTALEFFKPILTNTHEIQFH